MLLFIWMCVMAQAFAPAGANWASVQAEAYEAHLRAQIDAPAPASALLGAASHMTRYHMPRLARTL
ncbi:MAG: hypothetical protein AB7P07_02915 [Hyphomonadaceae bacterium]